ncbi:hypothetical protein [Methanothrix sp.]|uniref:hypothetical protein n=1 Tax=Methanothrix sp. TaxID=90426 RepID=UPI00257E878E|nr:hypothetical protein [Methanothrix sp.]NPU87757.1 hypothetical protein [Methanothrix sp.]
MGYPGYVIPHASIPDDSKILSYVSHKYGFYLKKEGFHRKAEYLKAIFEIFEIDETLKGIAKMENPILDATWDAIKRYTTLAESGECDNILFIVSLGGGTGTGFINPIVNYIRSGGRREFPVFVLGILTEEGEDSRTGVSEEQRGLAAAISIYDLLTKNKDEGVDALIPIDNQILIDKFGSNYTSINDYISRVMRPFLADRPFPQEEMDGQGLREEFLKNLSKPPVMIPCYASLDSKKSSNPETELVSKALTGSVQNDECGPLFPCNPEMAERAFVFSRGYISKDKLESSVQSITGLDRKDIFVWRKLGENRKSDVLVLLRNPYGSGYSGPFEKKMCRIISLALDYISQKKQETLQVVEEGDDQALTSQSTDALSSYFNRLTSELKNAKSRLKEGKKPFFLNELQIFERSSNNTHQQDNVIQNNHGPSEEMIRKIVQEELRKLLPAAT